MVEAGLSPAASEPSAIVAFDLAIAVAAILFEALLGYPGPALRAIGHPVMWIGALIGWLDRVGNRAGWRFGARQASGVVALCVLVAATAGPAAVLQAVLPAGFVSAAILGVLASTLLAQRSLHTHVKAVADGLERGGLAGGRVAVAHIVGRNPAALDEAGVVRAAIESLAENFSDGVVAPTLWCAAAGLPGILFYKAVNTADSMIGHRTARHAAFGWAAARLDDVINLPASRFSAVLLLAAALFHGADARGAWRAVWRDARLHRSPNAGWPEAAMAGALGLRLAGPRVYGTTLVQDAWMGDGSPLARPGDLRRALTLYRTACALQAACLVVVLAVVIVRG
jgi:adenosylcobinamide-phosphate synthase